MHITRRLGLTFTLPERTAFIGGIVKRAFEPLMLEKTMHEQLNGAFAYEP
jgi:hypothetical protein